MWNSHVIRIRKIYFKCKIREFIKLLSLKKRRFQFLKTSATPFNPVPHAFMKQSEELLFHWGQLRINFFHVSK